MILEACVENISEAINAEKQGASRIELCDNLYVGGTTPSAGTIEIAKDHLSIPIMVLIRPSGGDFVYSKEEIGVMKKDIEFCKKIGVKGIVIGALKEDKTIDTDLMTELIQLAKPLEITFHKAIDDTHDIIAEFKKLLLLDVDRVLTSGGYETAMEGHEVINEMVKLSNGKLTVLAAGKITNSNLKDIQKIVNTEEFHGKLIVGPLS